MAITALYASASGMKALDVKLSVLADNLANINTTGFKRSRTNFEDLFYQTRVEPGSKSAGAGEASTPVGLQVGLGTAVSNTQLNLTQGSIDVTNQPYDMAIEGNGFFQVNTTVGGQQITAYTRAGNFIVNANGNLVLGNSVGSVLEPAITVGQDVQEVQIGPTGQVSARVQGQTAFTQIGQLRAGAVREPDGAAVGRQEPVRGDGRLGRRDRGEPDGERPGVDPAGLAGAEQRGPGPGAGRTDPDAAVLRAEQPGGQGGGRHDAADQQSEEVTTVLSAEY